LEILILRKHQIKNFFTLLMIANGVPMFCAGDEFMQTQMGNNNPYNQDNETTWLDWDKQVQNADIYRFFNRMIAFRKSHASLCRDRFWREDIRWFGANGPVDASDTSHSIAFNLSGKAVNDRDLCVIVNMYWQNISFSFGVVGPWKRMADTSLDSPDDVTEAGSEIAVNANLFLARARSVVVFIS